MYDNVHGLFICWLLRNWHISDNLLYACTSSLSTTIDIIICIRTWLRALKHGRFVIFIVLPYKYDKLDLYQLTTTAHDQQRQKKTHICSFIFCMHALHAKIINVQQDHAIYTLNETIIYSQECFFSYPFYVNPKQIAHDAVSLCACICDGLLSQNWLQFNCDERVSKVGATKFIDRKSKEIFPVYLMRIEKHMPRTTFRVNNNKF